MANSGGNHCILCKTTTVFNILIDLKVCVTADGPNYCSMQSFVENHMKWYWLCNIKHILDYDIDNVFLTLMIMTTWIGLLDLKMWANGLIYVNSFQRAETKSSLTDYLKFKTVHQWNRTSLMKQISVHIILTLWTRRAGLAAYANRGPKTPAGRFSGICYGVSKTRRAFKPAHVRLIIKWFVYTGRYQATLRSQVESSSLFSFRTICNLLTGFCTRYTNLRRKYGGDTQCMWRYRYSLHVMDNVEE